MKHTAHKRIAHFKKRYKHIAAAFAGAILMSSALLPGIPIASVDAAMNPNVGNARDTSAQKMKNENREESSMGQQINSSKNPRNGSRPNVSGSEARNLIKQSLNRNKALKSPFQPAENGNTFYKPVKIGGSHVPSPATAYSSPATKNRADTSVKPNSDNKSDSSTSDSSTKNKSGASMKSSSENKSGAAKTLPAKSKENKKDTSSEKPKANPSNAASASDKHEDKQGSAAKSDQEKKQSDTIPTNYEKVLDIRATAYAPGPLDNDQWGDKTYMGTTIRPGVIAVDPKVIPLGSRLYVKYPDGHGEYAVAEDTGGAIKGNRIDIAMMNRGKASDFGIQDVKVYVVSSPEKE